MSLKMPEGIVHDEEIFNVIKDLNPNTLVNWGVHGINGPLDVRKASPYLAAILLYNDLIPEYERMISYVMDKHYGKHGRATILAVVITNDMGVDRADYLWNERSVNLNYPILKSFEFCDEKYIDYFVNSEKFQRNVKKKLSERNLLSWAKEYAERLILKGFENPKLAKIFSKMYEETNDDLFLPPKAKEIFLF